MMPGGRCSRSSRARSWPPGRPGARASRRRGQSGRSPTSAWPQPLGNDAYFGASDFASRPDLSYRLAEFAREYGVSDRAEVAWALHQAQQRSVESSKYFPISPAEGAAALRQVASELEWLHDNVATLVSLLR